MASRFRSSSGARVTFFAFQDIITSVSGILILVVLMLATELDKPITRSSDNNPELERRLAALIEEQAALDVLNKELRDSLAAARNAPAAGQIQTQVQELQARLTAKKRELTNAVAVAALQRAEQLERDARLGLSEQARDIEAIKKENERLSVKVAEARRKMEAAESALQRTEKIVLQSRARAGQLWVIPDTRGTTKEPLLVTVSGRDVLIERFDQPEKRLLIPASSARVDFRRFLSGVNTLDQYLVFLVRPSGISTFDALSDMVRREGIDIGSDAIEEKQSVNFSRPPPLESEPPATNVVPQAVVAATVPAAPGFPVGTSNVTPPRSVAPVPPTPPTVPSAQGREPSWWQRLLKSLGIG